MGVIEGLDATFNKSPDSNIAGGMGLAAEVPFGVGNRISPAACIELEEMIVFKEHDYPNDVVQTVQVCGDWDLDPTPDDWLDMNACDAQ